MANDRLTDTTVGTDLPARIQQGFHANNTALRTPHILKSFLKFDTLASLAKARKPLLPS